MYKKLAFSSFVSAIIGFVFSMGFQSMAYWGSADTLTMEWYWVGAILAYLFTLIAIILLLLHAKNPKKGNLEVFFQIISLLAIICSIVWTTFVIIGWQSGI